jgi:perosamine synthetase
MVPQEASMRLNLPYTDHREIEEIEKVLQTGFFTQGPKVAEFEKLVAEMVKSHYAFATSSCTTALHLALEALEIPAGSEILVADFTFPATANVVVQAGAIPVLVDIEIDTFTVDVDDLRSKITPRTSAILPVDTFGCAADMDVILRIAHEAGIPVIEDAACAFGTTYYDRFCGNLGTAGCFSFHPRKAITTGEGGMILTDDDALAEKIQLLRSHGGHRVGYWFEYEAAGYNYRLSDIQGAMGVAQMEKVPFILARKRSLAKQLTEMLSEIPEIKPPCEPGWGGHVYQSYVILVNESLDRDRMIRDLRALDIETTLGTYALHDQPFFQRTYGYATGQLKNSHAAFTRSITLPLYPQMTEKDLETIVSGVKQSIHNQKP